MRGPSRGGAMVALALVAGLATGCQSVVGLSLDELPTDPIAVTWWEPEPARRRAEMLREQEEQQLAQQKRGVASAESIGAFLGQRRGERERYPGRLAFVDPRSGEVTPIRSAPSGAIPLSWSDDRRRLLFLSNHKGSIQVYEYDRERDEVRAITAGRNPHLYADYGPGRQITYLEVVTGDDGRPFERIWVTDPAGKSPRPVLEDRRAQTMRLSPDGKTLLYVQRRDRTARRGGEQADLVAIDLATGEESRRGPGREPSFSPIGDWIVYSAPSRSGWRLRRMRADGSARSPVSGGIRDEEMPAVSPDGQFVVYVGEATGLDRLFVRRMDGSGDRILLDVGAFFSPVW